MTEKAPIRERLCSGRIAIIFPPWPHSTAGAPMLNEDHRRFLDSRRVGHLATADASGMPHVVPVCFAIAADRVYITIDQKPKRDPRLLKRLRNIAANPSAALVADRYDENWDRLGWVMLRGAAEILDCGAEHDRAQELLRARYPQYRRMRLDELPVIAIDIERVASWGALSDDGLPQGRPTTVE